MSSKSTIQSLKKAGRTAAKTGRATAKATRFTAARWRGLLPLLCAAAALVYAGITHLLTWIIASWEAPVLVAAVGVVLFVWADGCAGQLDQPRRNPAIAFVLFTTASAVALIVVPDVLGVYVAIIVVDLVLGTWWWNGTAYQSFRATDRAKRKMEAVLNKLGVSEGTRITSVKANKAGDLEWRLYLGDNDSPDQIPTERVAHLLKTDISRVIVRRVERGSTRSVKVVWLAQSPEKSADPVHPAVRPANRAKGAAWEPGTRSVRDGLVAGWQLGAAIHSVARLVTTKGTDIRHLGILGMTGSGKTSTVSGMILSAIACHDLVMGVCDIPKAGNAAAPFAKGLHRIATTYDELEADLRGLLRLGQDRIRRMNTGEVLGEDGQKLRKWRPTKADPVVWYLIEELGNTMRDLENEDPERAEMMWDLMISVVQSVRQAGISLGWISQDAKKESINTTFRKAMGTFIVHKVSTSQCVNGIFTEFDVDMFESGLPRAGMSLVGDVDGGEPVKALGFDMDTLIEKGREFNAAVDAYVSTRPFLSGDDVAVLGWGDALCGPVRVEGAPEVPEAATEAQEATEGPEAMALLQDAFNGQIPAGAPIIGGAVELAVGDDERLAAITAALAAADEPLTRAQIQKDAGELGMELGMTVTKKLLTKLQDDGKVEREGTGRSTKYRLARELVDA